MKSQRGSFMLGLVVGLLIGVAASLAVALYVTKVPVPFVNKVPQRTAEQDAAEVERNRRWDPNAPLGGRPASAPVATATPGPAAPPAPAVRPPPATSAVAARPPAASAPLARSAPPTGLPPVSAGAAGDPFIYFVQAGAYARNEEAEQQRARLAMLGYSAKVSEREQAGRTMYRVRLGPFERKDAAEGAQQQLADSGVEAALVRVQR